MSTTITTSKGARIGGYVLSGLPILFLLMDGLMKIFKPAFVVEATTKLGYSESVIIPLGIVLVICTLLYAGVGGVGCDPPDGIPWRRGCYSCARR